MSSATVLGKYDFLPYYLCSSSLTFNTLWGNSADENLMTFFLIFTVKYFDVSCNLNAKETICMKCQRLFSGQNKNIFSECRLLNVLPSVKFIKIATDKALLFSTKSLDIFSYFFTDTLL